MIDGVNRPTRIAGIGGTKKISRGSGRHRQDKADRPGLLLFRCLWARPRDVQKFKLFRPVGEAADHYNGIYNFIPST